MQLIDSHCHLDVAEFDGDRDEVMQRALDAGINDIIVPAIDQPHWQQLHELSEQHEGIHAAYGLHPMFMDVHRSEHLAQLDAWLDEHPAVAVGECGLDFYIPDHDEKSQTDLLEAQLLIARNHQLPVIIHCRRAMDQVLSLLRKTGPLKGVLHSFNGSRQQADQAMKLDFRFGVGGPITYERARKLRALIAGLPSESLLLETDAPDQPVSGHQGERNEPALMTHVLRSVAEIRNEAPEEVACYTSSNTRELFGI
jgi:TatD DNase family protein